ncbi:hypothetical protein [Flavobacterium facile]|uniref:hypothetical protein n=1 Tax=Flavobacterium facile TaxID=2893174 RepID=UPI002E78C6B3|nr:hypothetical protein [Flavobacterium sp. T-12]
MILRNLNTTVLKEDHYYLVKIRDFSVSGFCIAQAVKINNKLELQEEVLLSTLNKNKVTGIQRLSTKD